MAAAGSQVYVDGSLDFLARMPPAIVKALGGDERVESLPLLAFKGDIDVQFPSASETSEPLMRGVDSMGRRFIALRVRSKIPGISPFVEVLYQHRVFDRIEDTFWSPGLTPRPTLFIASRVGDTLHDYRLPPNIQRKLANVIRGLDAFMAGEHPVFELDIPREPKTSSLLSRVVRRFKGSPPDRLSSLIGDIRSQVFGFLDCHSTRNLAQTAKAFAPCRTLLTRLKEHPLRRRMIDLAGGPTTFATQPRFETAGGVPCLIFNVQDRVIPTVRGTALLTPDAEALDERSPPVDLASGVWTLGETPRFDPRRPVAYALLKAGIHPQFELASDLRPAAAAADAGAAAPAASGAGGSR